ncbi:hypothetical protein L596_020355 [Steinernema carpocapsae]|uniref:Uncharacterized protein n=1 Tax=Steinernema carpocapsae TaxID=34508 RepID=A0A4U5MTA3_STECR|nr:hypothetical protein L596_020355 [Steinernema carpocapsae]
MPPGRDDNRLFKLLLVFIVNNRVQVDLTVVKSVHFVLTTSLVEVFNMVKRNTIYEPSGYSLDDLDAVRDAHGFSDFISDPSPGLELA